MTNSTDSVKQPLAGVRVAITRAAERAASLVARLQALGAEPIVYPTIAHAPPADPAALDAALSQLEAGLYDWLLLTSVTAVEVVAERLGARAPQLARRVSLHVGAVGPSTAAACHELLGAAPSVVPESFLAAELASAIGDPAGRRVLLPNADGASPTLEQQLRAAGASVERVIAYRTVPAPPSDIDMPALLAAGAVDVVLFTSGSTARFFVEKIGPAALPNAQRTVIACIGPSTAATCRTLGLEPTVVSELSTEEGLLNALVAFWRQKQQA